MARGGHGVAEVAALRVLGHLADGRLAERPRPGLLEVVAHQLDDPQELVADRRVLPARAASRAAPAAGSARPTGTPPPAFRRQPTNAADEQRGAEPDRRVERAIQQEHQQVGGHDREAAAQAASTILMIQTRRRKSCNCRRSASGSCNRSCGYARLMLTSLSTGSHGGQAFQPDRMSRQAGKPDRLSDDACHRPSLQPTHGDTQGCQTVIRFLDTSFTAKSLMPSFGLGVSPLAWQSRRKPS